MEAGVILRILEWVEDYLGEEETPNNSSNKEEGYLVEPKINNKVEI